MGVLAYSRQLARTRPLLVYCVLAYGLAWLGAIPLIVAARNPAGPQWPAWWDAVLAFAPGVAAVAVVALQQGSSAARAFLAACFDPRGLPTAAWILAVGLPLAIFIAALVLGAVRHDALPAPAASISLASLAFLTPALLAALSGPGEEPGWRGWVLARALERGDSPWRATLIVAALWIPWHLPMFFYRDGFGSAQFGVFAFALLCGSIWLTEIQIAARGRVFAAIAWHAAWNFLATIARALEPSIFPWMTGAVLLGAIVIVIRWRVHARRSAAASSPRAASPRPDRA
jgi:hypothetical protein